MQRLQIRGRKGRILINNDEVKGDQSRRVDGKGKGTSAVGVVVVGGVAQLSLQIDRAGQAGRVFGLDNGRERE